MDHLIPYASKHAKPRPPADPKAKRPTRAWRPDRGFSASEMRDPAARDRDRPFPRARRPRTR